MIPVEAVLWRRWNRATFDTLHGESPGQYDIRLTTLPELPRFLKGARKTELTSRGGYTLTFDLEPHGGSDPVPGTKLAIRYIGDRSVRKDWIISSQRPDTAYPLWQPGRGIPKSFDRSLHEYVMLIRDVDGGFHARWISEGSLKSVPQLIQSAMKSRVAGVLFI